MNSSTLHFPFPVVGPPRRHRPGTESLPDTRAAFLIHPPYRQMELRSSLTAIAPPQLRPGTVVGLRLTTGADWTSLQQPIRELRLRLPSAAIVLASGTGSDLDFLLSARASRGGVRAVLNEQEPFAEQLRAALTSRDSLADDVVDWLVLRRLRLSPTVASLLREIFTHAPTSPDLSSLLARVGMAESSARFRLHKRLLPTPSRWFQAARALHCVLRLQAEPRMSLLRIAHEFGYTDHSALSQLVYRAFGVRPGTVRGTFGWEWLMHRWMSSIPEVARSARIT